MHQTHATRRRVRHAHVLLVLIAAATLWWGCSGPLTNAGDALSAGNLDQAERYTRQALGEAPDDPEAHLMLARIAVARDDIAAADAHSLDAVRLAPRSAAVRRVRARILLEGNRPGPACVELAALQALDPGSLPTLAPDGDVASLLERSGKAALDAGFDRGAVSCFDTLEARDPQRAAGLLATHIDAKRRQASTFVAGGRYDDALTVLDWLVVKDVAASGTDHLQRGKLLAELGRDDEAIAAFDAYIAAAEGSDAAARAGAVGNHLDSIGRRVEAAEYLERAVATSDAPPALALDLARVHLRLGNEARAREAIGLALAPDRQPLADDFVEAAAVATELGWVDIAIEVLEQGTAAHPTAPEPTLGLATLYDLRGEQAQVEATFAAFAEAASGDAAALATVADWLFARGYDELSVYYYERAAALPDAPPDLQLKRARAQLAAVDYQAMERALQAHIARNDGSTEARIAAADIALEARDGQLAVEILEPAFAASPGDRRVAELLAEAYSHLGQLPDEVRVYETWARNAEDRAGARLIVGQVLAELGEDERAEAWLQEAAADPATAVDGHFALGTFYHVAGRREDARAAFDAFIAAHPQPLDAMRDLMAWYRTRAGSLDDAIAIGERMATQPGGEDGLLLVAELYLEANDRASALDAHRRYVDARQDDPVTATRVVTDAAARYDIDYAEQLIGEMVERHPQTAGMHALAGDIAMVHASRVVGDDLELAASLRAQADASYARYLDLATASDPALERFVTQTADRRQYALSARGFELGGDALASPRLQLTRADVLTRLGRHEEAGAVYTAYVEQGEGEPAARALDVSRRLIDAGRAQDAEPFLRLVLESDTREGAIQAYQGLATLLISSGRRDELRELSRTVLERTSLPWETREVVARSSARAGLYDEALAHYRAMLQMRPNAMSVATDIAQLGFLGDDPGAARAALQAFVEQSATPSLAWRTIGDFYAERGEAELAIEAWQQSLSASQREPDRDLVLRLGALQARVGRADDAIATFEQALETSNDSEDSYVEAVRSLADAQQLEAADALATAAIDRVQRPGPFLLFKIRRAVATGQRASALLWAEEYQRRGAPLAALVEELIALGAFDSARALIDDEVQRGEWDEATRHAVALAPRSVLYRGLDRFLMSAKRVAGAVYDPGPLLRAMAVRQADAGHLEEALVLAGERLWSPASTREDALLRAELQLDLGYDADAFDTLLDLVSQGEDRDKHISYAASLDVLLDAGRLELAVRLLEHGLGLGHLSLLEDLVALHVETGDPDAALDLLRGGPMAHVFERRANADEVAAATTALQRLARLGFGDEAAKLLAVLDETQGPSVAIATARVEALALDGGAGLASALDDHRAAHGDDAASADVTHTLALAGADAGETLGVLGGLVSSHDPYVARQALRDAVLLAPSDDDGAALDALVDAYISARHDQARAHLDVAATMLGLGEFDRAAGHYRVASELLPSESSVFEGLAEAHFLRGDSAAAIEAMERAADRRRDRLETLERLATRFADGPDAGVARAALRRVLEANPANAQLRLELARQAWLAGDASDGDAQAEALYESSDQPAVVAGAVIGVLLEANQVDRAVEWSARLVDDPHASDLGLWHAGVALVRAGRHDDAVPVFERAVARSLGPLELQVATAEVFRRHGRLDQAERFLEKAIEAHPASPAPHLYRGLFRLEQGDLEGARLEFDLVREAAWQPTHSLALIGDALLAAGHGEAAEAYLAPLLSLRSVDAATRVDAVLDVFAAHGQAERGIEFVESTAPGLLVQPERRPALAHALGVALLRAGRAEDAREIGARLTRVEPEVAMGWDLLARAHLALDALGEADRAAARASLLAEGPERGRYLATSGRIAAARQALDEAESYWLAALRLDAGGNPEWAATVLRALAWAAEERGGDAQPYLRRAARASAQTLQPDALR